ncbi:MAG: hypothetical protein ACR2MA_07595 [Egibacteraceae bacterium]
MSAPPLEWQSGFVRARRKDVHPLLADVVAYESWWPGVESRAGEHGTDLRWRGLLGDQRLRVRVRRTRPLRGVELALDGAFVGTAEWYYLDAPSGVVVSYLLRATTPRKGARRRLRQHRTAVRNGLLGLKARLEGSRLTGAEPDPRLLAGLRHDRAEPGAPLAEAGF